MYWKKGSFRMRIFRNAPFNWEDEMLAELSDLGMEMDKQLG